MRKRIVSPVPKDSPLPDGNWLDVERLAQVEVTSEDAAHPIESALGSGAEPGWQAGQSGRQTIRLIFDRPQRLRRIWLLFTEPDVARTQEFALSGVDPVSWTPHGWGGKEHPRCRRAVGRIHPSSGSVSSSGFAKDGRPRSSGGSSRGRPSASGTGC